MGRFPLIAAIGLTTFAGGTVHADATACSTAKVAEVLAPATTAGQSVLVNCSLELAPGDVVTKRIVVRGAAGSNTTIDCNGATIDGGPGTVNSDQSMVIIQSRTFTDPGTGLLAWERPEHVEVRECDVRGTVRVVGMGGSGNAVQLRDSSRQSGHVSRARANAPRYITLDDVTISPRYDIPLYVSPGVSYLTLSNSELAGSSHSVAIYLDAESTGTTIRDNYIHTNTGNDRELIAVDASNYNRIFGNFLSNLDEGGIYLYRNCGEAGTIRITTPSNNQIMNNVFYYNVYSGSEPAVYIGSRNGNRNYCGDDSGWSYGSSSDNRDFARSNIVMQNQIYKRSIVDMIRIGGSVNTGNVIEYNDGGLTSHVSRLTGCYYSPGYLTDLVEHGEELDLFEASNGEPWCPGLTVSCNDNQLSYASSTTCSLQTISIGCSVTGNNNGCSRAAACPGGRMVVGGVAACNLEFGSVSQTQLDEVPWSHVEVVVPSDNVSQGLCWIGSSIVSTGQREIDNIIGLSGVGYGCRETDSNGGDCHIRGTLWCY